MKTIIAQILLLVCFTCSAQKERIVKNGNIYILDFVDEFTNIEIDTNKWSFRFDSKHWSTQLKENIELKNGMLYLNLKKEISKGKEYTGAGIISVDTFKYGYYESRMRIPKGQGWHTSFWLMKYDNSGGTNPVHSEVEIDIIENDSKNACGYEVAFHRWQGEHKSVGYHVKTPDMSKEFVTIACEYTPEFVKYYMNGNEMRHLNISEYPKGFVNIWLTSIASHLGGTESVDETKLPDYAIFDYVRYYRLEGNAP